uniref:C2 domain-containing protein n=1 Tax=Ditylum brightwellii TaxID=49249 RepID=A0A7S4RZK8_9STRA
MKVQLSLYAKNLPKVTSLFQGAANPYAVVKTLSEDGKAVDVGKTEVVTKTLDPTWTTRFILEHDFETTLHVSVAVFHKDDKGEPKPMGSALIDVVTVADSKPFTVSKGMKGGGE